MSEGQSLNNIVISLVPAGNISGVIRDSDGQAQTGVPIQLLRATFNATGERTFHVEGTARTNDRGEYRLYWITPGRYYISAGTASGPNRPLSPNSTSSSLNEIPGQSFALTYFPGVLEVNPGADVTGVDFSLRGNSFYSIRGRIAEAGSGRPPLSASVSLAYRTPTGVAGAFNAGSRYDARQGSSNSAMFRRASMSSRPLPQQQRQSPPGKPLCGFPRSLSENLAIAGDDVMVRRSTVMLYLGVRL